MALPTTDGRSERPLAGVMANLRFQLVDHLYNEINEAGPGQEYARKTLAGLFEGLTWVCDSDRVYVAYLTRGDVRETITYLFGLDGEPVPLCVWYEVFVPGTLGKHRSRRLQVREGTILRRFADEALDAYRQQLDAQFAGI
jgi:hypothetical protein